eukprot:5447786-Pleurochrysis_carterae.AAC.2
MPSPASQERQAHRSEVLCLLDASDASAVVAVAVCSPAWERSWLAVHLWRSTVSYYSYVVGDQVLSSSSQALHGSGTGIPFWIQIDERASSAST